ncbi:MAG: DNA topoisomerase III [Enterococcus sp.]
MKTVILAEKPSQAKAYADSFKKSARKDGYYEIIDPLYPEGAIITYGFGHLVDMVPPGTYDPRWKKWSLEELPIFPEKYRFEVPRDKKKQFAIVKKFLKDAETIVIATDSDREGESIAWSIIQQAGAFTKGKTYLRLWINSLEKDAIYQGFQNLQPGQNYFPKFKEAQSRQIADWLIGMNGSPLYSLLLRKKGITGSFSLGRVQTPTLFMIYQLQEAIKVFVKEPYFEGSALITSQAGEFSGKLDPKKKFKTKDEVIAYLKEKGAVPGEQEGVIRDVETKQKSLVSPRLFTLSSLQSRMNQLMKASAKATLEATQGLYEAKFLSYPRTDTPFITDSEHAYLVQNLERYKSFFGLETTETPVHQAKRRFVQNDQVQEHHAIIPTKTIPTKARYEKLSPLQKAIYQQVVKTTIAMFAKEYVYEETTVFTGVQQLVLKSVGKVPIHLGWRQILPVGKKEQQKDTLLPKVMAGESVRVTLETLEKETQPPKPYTEGTLITAMKTAGKTVDDEQAQEILNEVEGIGTEATRANIIETLKKKEYIQVEKNYLYVTPKGSILCQAVEKEALLTSAEMTAKWEGYLNKIGKQEGSQEAFLANIKKYITHLLDVVPQQLEQTDMTQLQAAHKQVQSEKPATGLLGVCPKCKKGKVNLYPKIATCNNKECDFKLWPTIAKKKLTKTAMKELLKDGRTSKPVKGMKGKKGSFDAYIVLKEDFTTGFEFPNNPTTAPK